MYIYIDIWWICLNLCSVKRKFQCPISQLKKTIFAWNFEGGLIDHQRCFIPNFKFLAVQKPNFLEPKFGQNRLLTGLTARQVFLYFPWIWLQGYVGLFVRCIWSPYRLASLLITIGGQFLSFAEKLVQRLCRESYPILTIANVICSYRQKDFLYMEIVGMVNIKVT